MKKKPISSLKYGYCTNTFASIDMEQLVESTLTAAQKITQAHPTATLDLQLGHLAIQSLGDATCGAQLAERLAKQHLLVTSLNVFPLGDFQAPVVKEQVYHPDWWDPNRPRLTELAARWVGRDLQPQGIFALSTLPGRFHKTDRPTQNDFASFADQLNRFTPTLARLSDEFNCQFILALEPEPFTTLETLEDVERLWNYLDNDTARTHLGVNLDCCHFSVMGESPLSALKSLTAAGIPVPKIHVSTALDVALPAQDSNRQLLESLVEPRYLHQTILHGSTGQRRYADLPVALAELKPDDERATCHFHLPLFLDEDITTGADTRAVIDHVLETGLETKMFLETYTWSVSGTRWAPDPVAGLIKELDWLVNKLSAEPR